MHYDALCCYLSTIYLDRTNIHEVTVHKWGHIVMISDE